MPDNELEALRRAVKSLEHPGLPARLAGMVGKPLNVIAQTVPSSVAQVISAAAERGIEAALKVALLTMKDAPSEGSRIFHKSLAGDNYSLEESGGALPHQWVRAIWLFFVSDNHSAARSVRAFGSRR